MIKKMIIIIVCSLTFTQSIFALEEPAFKITGLSKDDYELGTRQYLVYFKEVETSTIKWMSLWSRTTKIIEKDGEELVEISQKWQSEDPRFQRELYSLNRLEDFSPVTHFTLHGKDKIKSGYTFSKDKISGDTHITDNSKAEFSMVKQDETLNWELDMETFALLPLEAGKVFNLNFYHPGSKTKPQAYAYKVVGEEVLIDMSGKAIECWKLRINYNNKDFGIFWLEKTTGQMIKMEEVFGKMMKFKVRLGVLSKS